MEKEYKVQFDSCFGDQPTDQHTLKFVNAETAKTLGEITIRTLTGEIVEKLGSDPKQLILASIVRWSFPDNGTPLELTLENFNKLNAGIRAKVLEKINQLNFVSEAERKN
ncbi:MAG: hypothetical protein MN733_02980 [Nitrososphaera sp.]|nr:hypothetical protein [Nitrososphaera sp.]